MYSYTKSYRPNNLKRDWIITIGLTILWIVLIFLSPNNSLSRFFSPLSKSGLTSLTEGKGSYEVFGFAPYWTFDKLDNVDFNVLTTLAYFGVPISSSGDLERGDIGYITFKSQEATTIFKKAHRYGTRVVLTLTQMDNSTILALMDNEEGKKNAISQIVTEVQDRGIDGINVDFEYIGDPGHEYRTKFTRFVGELTKQMHAAIPASKVTVSVYASSVKDPKMYDIKALSEVSDGIFMMAYDFAVAGSDVAMPTAPLYGHKTGKYWYDVATAVEDFLSYMPARKLILGVPYYGYNYLVYEPAVKAETRPYWSWRGRPMAQTYSLATENIRPDRDDIDGFKTGWDQEGAVSWIAYHLDSVNTWRMIFLEDPKSLRIKYDFVKEKGLHGVGMWALGFDEGRLELWELLAEKFGIKLADSNVTSRIIN